MAPILVGQLGLGTNNESTLRALTAGRWPVGSNWSPLSLSEVYCVPGNRHLSLFVSDCRKILKGEKVVLSLPL